MENKTRKEYSSLQFKVKRFENNEDIVRLSGIVNDVPDNSIVDVGGETLPGGGDFDEDIPGRT